MSRDTLNKKIKAANRYRDTLNPMRGLTVGRAVTLLESYNRGEWADLMWTYGAPVVGIESADPDLLALIERRTSALVEMDFDITLSPRYAENPQAEQQQEFLAAVLENVSNMSDLIAHLEMSAFRGHALAEIVTDASGEITFALVEPWNVVRDGTAPRYRLNPEAMQTSYSSLPTDYEMETARWIILDHPRPIGRIALIKIIRQNLSQKDWDSFIEIYGIPGGVVTLPADVPQEKEAQYLDAAEEIARGGAGALPNGSTYTANDSPRGVNPFRDHLKFLTEQLVLAGTGGRLTMLAEAGSGTLAGGAHADTFRTIAAARAKLISETIQKQFFTPLLKQQFPGQRVMAYFEIAHNETTDVADIVAHAATLAGAGFLMDAAELSEKTGYKLTYQAPQPATPSPSPLPNKGEGAPLANNFNPDQPHDPDSKFASTGSAGSAGGSSGGDDGDPEPPDALQLSDEEQAALDQWDDNEFDAEDPDSWPLDDADVEAGGELREQMENWELGNPSMDNIEDWHGLEKYEWTDSDGEVFEVNDAVMWDIAEHEYDPQRWGTADNPHIARGLEINAKLESLGLDDDDPEARPLIKERAALFKESRKLAAAKLKELREKSKAAINADRQKLQERFAALASKAESQWKEISGKLKVARKKRAALDAWYENRRRVIRKPIANRQPLTAIKNNYLAPLGDLLAGIEKRAADLSPLELQRLLEAAANKLPEIFDGMEAEEFAAMLEAGSLNEILTGGGMR